VERVILWFGAPKAVVGIAIAILVLLPESLAALAVNLPRHTFHGDWNYTIAPHCRRTK